MRDMLVPAAVACVLSVAWPAWPHEAHEYPWGRAGDARSATRTIRVEMHDALRYAPDRIAVKRGETIRFVVHNAGRLPHEMVIGSERDLREHAEAMRKHPGMRHALKLDGRTKRARNPGPFELVLLSGLEPPTY